MKRLYYVMTTVDPVIISQNSATTNNHECLDYFPGSTILGAVAAQLYTQLSPEQSWKMFHSGSVRFGPCYPVIEGELGLPTPASWHFAKGSPAVSGHAYNRQEISNQASEWFHREERVQYKQCRDGYINARGQTTDVLRGVTTKTALNSETGIAATSQLFSYAYIERAQTFAGWVDSEDEFLLKQVRDVLNREIRLGRSRNSEFGRVSIEPINITTVPSCAENPNTLVLWCLSDCECLNDSGQPTFTPSLGSIIASIDGELDPSYSFIRTSKISRFNQKRGGLETEQQLISKGSVLVYRITHPLSELQRRKLAEIGIGINKHQGLGWVMVNPPWAFEATLPESSLFDAIHIPVKAQQSDNLETDSPLTQWVRQQMNKADQALSDQEQVSQLLREIVTAYREARFYNNIVPSHQAGPSGTQWRRISDALRDNRNNWQHSLFDAQTGICKAKNDELGWGIQWHDGKKYLSFSAFLNNKLTHVSKEVILTLVTEINHYDLSTLAGLNKAERELHLQRADNIREEVK